MENNTKSRTCKRVSSKFSQVDMFGEALEFNVAGKRKVNSVMGAIFSSLLGLLLIVYAASRL